MATVFVSSIVPSPPIVIPGICEVEDTPKGWFIKYVDRSPATLAKMAVSAASVAEIHPIAGLYYPKFW